MGLDLEKDLKDYSKQELLTLLKTQSAKDLVVTKKSIKDEATLYNYLCKLVNHMKEYETYESIKYRVLYKKDLDLIFKQPLLKDSLDQFKKKCPMILESDPLILDQKTKYKRDVSKILSKGDLICFYRDYEKNVPCYLHFRVLK